MRYVKWTFWGLLALLVLAFLHYTLPQRDIVRLVDTYSKIQPVDLTRIFWSHPPDQSRQSVPYDVHFIQTVKTNGKTMEYRNEDTGWWPPYLKFDTAALQTEAADAKSTKESPQWYAMTHYGWRSKFLSAFPNAVKLKPVAGPDVTLIPWFNIVLLVVLAALIRTFQVRIRRWWRRIRGTGES